MATLYLVFWGPSILFSIVVAPIYILWNFIIKQTNETEKRIAAWVETRQGSWILLSPVWSLRCHIRIQRHWGSPFEKHPAAWCLRSLLTLTVSDATCDILEKKCGSWTNKLWPLWPDETKCMGHFLLDSMSFYIFIFGLVQMSLEASLCWAHFLFPVFWHCPLFRGWTRSAMGKSPV